MVTGANTALPRKGPSAPIKWLSEKSYMLDFIGRGLDYGCGHGADAEYLGIEKYDPRWHAVIPEGAFDTIFCTYVLNVVTPQAQADILLDIRTRLNRCGLAFITVRRDIPREGSQGRGCYQRYVTLPFRVIRETSAYCIYAMEKGDAI
jgi:hypothetical protein